ncbi:hypothetical protein HWV62_12719 [Athelia sp. TMB]|nr:hypothetical protein HWV62_12719 [Athelia sp. TMB]
MSLESDAHIIDDFGQDRTNNGSNRFLVLQVDGVEALVTAAIAGGLALRWHVDCAFKFSPSSNISLEIWESAASQQRSNEPRVIGRWDGQGTELLVGARFSLKGENSVALASSISLSLEVSSENTQTRNPTNDRLKSHGLFPTKVTKLNYFLGYFVASLESIVFTFNTIGSAHDAHVVNVGRDNITYIENTGGMGLGTYNMVSSIESRLKVVDDSKLGRNVHHWLSPPDVSQNYNAARRKHQLDTGIWFINSASFAEWKIRSETGCGKTILCSSIIKDVITFCEKNSLLGYAYFFFDSRNNDKRLLLVDNLIRSLLSQLSYRCGGIPAELKKIYHAHGDGRAQPSLESLYETLRRVIEGFDGVYVMIDSLDECGERNELLRWIKIAMGWKSQKLHLVFTSRPEPDIQSHLKILVGIRFLRMDGLSQGDIGLFLDQELRHISHWDQKTRDLVRNTLSERADGMFRWVALQITDLQHCLNLREVREQLDALPRDLEGTYERILTKSRRHRDLLQILHWLAFSARDLSVEEISEVVSVHLDATGGPVFDSDLRYGDPKIALIVCSGLVIETNGIVKLAHFSVKEYLVSDRIGTSPAAGFRISEKISHSVIAKTCLAYLLSFDKLESLTSENIDTFPLSAYAAEHWIDHYRSAEPSPHSPSDFQELLLRLFGSTQSHAMVHWVRLKDPDDPDSWSIYKYDRPAYSVAPPLYYASLIDLRSIVDHLLNNGADPNELGGSRGVALQAASCQGHVDTAQLLLRRGADVNTEAGYYGTALKAASFEGHIETAELLLEHGADVNLQAGKNGTPLQAASYRGLSSMVKLLLDRGADVNLLSERYGTALHASAIEGDIEMAKLLLDHGADVNLQAGYHGTALQAVSYWGNIKTARLLLGCGADVNAIAGTYGTALQAASYQGHIDMVQLLLNHGALVNVQSGIYETALLAALYRRHAEIANLLLDNGADADLHGHHGTVLQAVAYWGGTEMAKLLLDHGVDVNLQSGSYGTALGAASYWGRTEIVELLLNHGADVNLRVGETGTALHWAAIAGELETTKLLLAHGVDVNIKAGRYGTALQAARLFSPSRMRLSQIPRLLVQYGAVAHPGI